MKRIKSLARHIPRAATVRRNGEEAPPRDRMEYDVVIVGGGPSGLSAAIKLKQLAKAAGTEVSVCLLEKASSPGAHILSGACIEPHALDELIPDWKALGAPLTTPAADDRMYFLTKSSHFRLPVVPSMHNHGNYIGSLGELMAWLSGRAEEAGVEIFSGFAADAPLISDGKVIGVITKDAGISKSGEKTDNYTPSVELAAKQVILAEGCRGSVTKKVEKLFNLREGKDVPTYALGFKELWEVPKEHHRPGFIQHTMGWPLDNHSYGGSFLYHYGENLVSYGLVIGLDYINPHINLYKEFQRLKTHKLISSHLEGGTCVAYGARSLNEGGLLSAAKPSFPGGLIVGDANGTLNLPKIKGTHTAMKSGMLAAEAVFDEVIAGGKSEQGHEVGSYLKRFNESWIYKELYKVRNYRQSFSKFGMAGGTIYCGISEYVTRGIEPWNLKHAHQDYTSCEPAAKHKKIDYPKPDGVLTFDLLTNLARSGTNHNADQPAHLKVVDAAGAKQSYAELEGIETRFCPAQVYERHLNETTKEYDLKINAQNCLHCKACDCKLPWINWQTPEGSGGPQYTQM